MKWLLLVVCALMGAMMGVAMKVIHIPNVFGIAVAGLVAATAVGIVSGRIRYKTQRTLTAEERKNGYLALGLFVVSMVAAHFAGSILQ